MAVTTRNYPIPRATPAAIITALESALKDLGWHAATTNGYILTFTNTAGTTISAAMNKRYLVRQSSTSGSGTGAIFDILRSPTGAISTITLVTGGSGYANTNTITIQGSLIGGVNTTDDITITVSTVADNNGSTTTFFDQDITTSPTTSAWGVAKVINDGSKKLGTTFWNFMVGVEGTGHMQVGGVKVNLYVRAFTGFNSSANSAQGVTNLDFVNTAVPTNITVYSIAIPVASTSGASINLRVRQSGVDSNFATFSFWEGNNNRNPFVLSKFNSSYQPWSLDDVFLGGAHEIFSQSTINVSDAALVMRTRITAIPKRMAEAGYSPYFFTNTTSIVYTNTPFRSQSGQRQTSTPVGDGTGLCMYSRVDGELQDGVNTVSVMKNVPINPSLAPVPYYMPNDFVLAEIPFSNVNIGDTLTVSVGSEVYTVIQSAVNQASFTSIVLAARTT